MRDKHDSIEERLRRDADAFQAECAALDHQGALARTLAYLTEQGLLPVTGPGRDPLPEP